MKKITFTCLLILVLFTQCKKAAPTSFDSKALQQEIQTTKGRSLTLDEAFSKQKGKVVFVDIWASWCGDCLRSIPKVKALKEKYGEDVIFLYLSMDKDVTDWQNAIAKHHLDGTHFYLGSEWETTFNTSINLKWIPRFMILDKEGSIALYNAEKADDPLLEKTLDKLTQP